MLEKIQGCLYGLAIGDALGAPVEFLNLNEIKEHYGDPGITDYHFWGGFEAGSFTDDTQMSLATALGLLNTTTDFKHDQNNTAVESVYQAYQEWYHTQHQPAHRRAPGRTCLQALSTKQMGTMSTPLNDSKGCGGVMRTAPAGLVFPPIKAFLAGAQFAALTHSHPTGFLTGGFLAEVISRLMSNYSLLGAVETTLSLLEQYDNHLETLTAIKNAVHLARTKMSPLQAITKLGHGWVAEEALAISLYCSLKFSDNFSECVLAAVNHDGDSDSTGSITGAILGTHLGRNHIPEKWIKTIEKSETINEIAQKTHKHSIFSKNTPLFD